MSDFVDNWLKPVLEFELAVIFSLIAIAIPVALGMAMVHLLTRNRRR